MFCSNCGAPFEGNFCSNCGMPASGNNTTSGIPGTADPGMAGTFPSQSLYTGNLEEVEVKEASLSFVAFFMLIWGLGFGGIPLSMMISSIQRGRPESPFLWLFILAGMVGVGFFFYKVVLLLLVSLQGEETVGTVVAYRNDMSSSNGSPNQIALIKVSEGGKEMILCYQVGSPRRPFSIGSNVTVKRRGNIVRVTKRQPGIADGAGATGTPFL